MSPSTTAPVAPSCLSGATLSSRSGVGAWDVALASATSCSQASPSSSSPAAPGVESALSAFVAGDDVGWSGWMGTACGKLEGRDGRGDGLLVCGGSLVSGWSLPPPLEASDPAANADGVPAGVAPSSSAAVGNGGRPGRGGPPVGRGGGVEADLGGEPNLERARGGVFAGRTGACRFGATSALAAGGWGRPGFPADAGALGDALDSATSSPPSAASETGDDVVLLAGG